MKALWFIFEEELHKISAKQIHCHSYRYKNKTQRKIVASLSAYNKTMKHFVVQTVLFKIFKSRLKHYIFKCLRQEQFYTFKQTLQKAVFGNVICLSLQGSMMIFLSRKNYIFVITSSWILLNCMVVERLFGNICCMLLKIYIYKKHEELKEQSYSC